MDTETYNVGISNHPLINDCEENEHSMLLGQNVRHHHGMVFFSILILTNIVSLVVSFHF